MVLFQPFMRTDFSRRAFRSSAPSVWNSLNHFSSATLSVFKSRPETLYSLRLSLNTDPTGSQLLGSYGRMTLYEFDYYAALLLKEGAAYCVALCLSVRLSVCPSVPLLLPSVTSRHLANYNDTHVLTR